MLNGSTIASDHALKRARSTWGTPISSAITTIGSGCENSCTKSNSVRPSSASSSWAAVRSISGRISRIRLLVKSGSRKSRTFVCRGGSLVEQEASGSQPLAYSAITPSETPPGFNAIGLTPLA